MKEKFTLQELDSIAHNAYKSFDLACQDIEEYINNELEVDYENEGDEELVYNLNQYIYPWADYQEKIDALKWLKENNYIEEDEYENA